MAMSACPKCAMHRFEMKEAEPANAHFKQMFIQCASCGCVVGVTSYYDPGAVGKDNEKRINALGAKIDQVSHDLRVIEDKINRIAQNLK